MKCIAMVAIAATLTLSACSGLGTVSPDLVELYDIAAPDGLIELEIERSGAIREMEVDVPVDALPAAIRDAAMARAPGATITGAEREITKNGKGWEVKLTDKGRGWELVYDDRATLLETEQELSRDEAPAAVLEAADQAVPGGTFRSVEVIERGEHREFHVKKMRDNVSYKIVLGPDGSVIRKVREHRAEIEIPLKD